MDGMTIDEVIKYFDDDAKENSKKKPRVSIRRARQGRNSE